MKRAVVFSILCIVLSGCSSILRNINYEKYSPLETEVNRNDMKNNHKFRYYAYSRCAVATNAYSELLKMAVEKGVSVSESSDIAGREFFSMLSKVFELSAEETLASENIDQEASAIKKDIKHQYLNDIVQAELQQISFPNSLTFLDSIFCFLHFKVLMTFHTKRDDLYPRRARQEQWENTTSFQVENVK